MQYEPVLDIGFSHKMSLEKGVPSSWALIVEMQAGERLSLEQIRAFLEASNEVTLQGGIGSKCTAG